MHSDAFVLRDAAEPARARAARRAGGLVCEAGRARGLTHLIATNKPRTVETLKGLAIASGLGADRNGDGTPDGTDVDLVPGDGIQQYPPEVLECAVGFERTLDSLPYIVEAIRSLPAGSQAVVANHSETLYAVIEEATGVDTSDPDLVPEGDGERYPREELQ